MSTFQKDSLESMQVYDDDFVGGLKRMNKGSKKIEDLIDEIYERNRELEYERKDKQSSND